MNKMHDDRTSIYRSGEQTTIEHLTDLQIGTLFNLALTEPGRTGSHIDEFRHFVRMESRVLIQAFAECLTKLDLTTGQAAQLLGVTDWTIRRWMQSNTQLPKATKAKVAAMVVLLRVAAVPEHDREIAGLVRAAIASTDDGANDRSSTNTAAGLPGHVASVFGPTGLMAVALYGALAACNADDTQTPDHAECSAKPKHVQ